MKLYTNNNKYAGSFDTESKIFAKIANPNLFVIEENGYGIQEEVLNQLVDLDCLEIWIITFDGKQHQSLLPQWIGKEPKDCGFGLCRYLNLDEMTIPHSTSTTIWE